MNREKKKLVIIYALWIIIIPPAVIGVYNFGVSIDKLIGAIVIMLWVAWVFHDSEKNGE